MTEQKQGQGFAAVPVPDGCLLRRKEVFEYTTSTQTYQIELFENQDGTFYAIGLPSAGRVVVYGSSVVASEELALRMVIDKIARESGYFEDSDSP